MKEEENKDYGIVEKLKRKGIMRQIYLIISELEPCRMAVIAILIALVIAIFWISSSLNQNRASGREFCVVEYHKSMEFFCPNLNKTVVSNVHDAETLERIINQYKCEITKYGNNTIQEVVDCGLLEKLKGNREVKSFVVKGKIENKRNI